MLNLLPQEDKKKLVTDYKLRFSTTTAAFICILLIVAIVGLLPAYLSRRSEMQSLMEQKQQADAQNSEASLQEAGRLAAENQVLVAFLGKRVDALRQAPATTAIIQGVLDKKTNKVTLTSLEVSGNQVSVRGVAETRANLIAFHEALRQNPLFKNSILPISDLAKSVRVEFSIAITLP